MSNKVIRLDTMVVYPTAAAAAEAIGVNRSSVIRAIKSETPCKGVHVAEMPDRFNGFDVSSDVVKVWCASEILRRAGFVGCVDIAAKNEKEENIVKHPYWEDIKNSAALTEQLRTIVESAAIECRNYQTDVYLYINEESGEGELYEFTNVGGNSWLDDDHITIWRDREHTESKYDACEEISEFASALDIPEDELIKTAKEWYAVKYDMEVEDEDIDWIVIRDMIDSTEPLREAYDDWFRDYVKEDASDWIKDTVGDIISSYDAEVYEREQGDRDEW